MHCSWSDARLVTVCGLKVALVIAVVGAASLAVGWLLAEVSWRLAGG